jgi:hypothetical protein
MSYLRDLNLSDNLITYIEPNAGDVHNKPKSFQGNTLNSTELYLLYFHVSNENALVHLFHGNFSVYCGHPRREFAVDTTAQCCTRRITAQPFWLFRSIYANLTSGLDIKYRDNGTGFVEVGRAGQKSTELYLLYFHVSNENALVHLFHVSV